jgi:hypothetical protein
MCGILLHGLLLCDGVCGGDGWRALLCGSGVHAG